MDARNPRRWWILIVLCLSTLVLVVDNMALTVAVPALTEDLGASAQDMQWILDSYILLFAGLLLTGMLLMAASFGLLTTLTADSGFTVPAVALGILGLGAGLAMPAAVAALMSTIPEEKAGVGSALDDTILQSGTALGIAILGSLLSGGYRDEMPAGAPEQARESLGGALAVAGDTGLVRAAREAFTASMSTTFTISAIGVLAAAVVATLVMRDRKPEAAPEAEVEVDAGPARAGSEAPELVA